MKTRDFSFDLPEELIAQFPSDRRDQARLLLLNRETGRVAHRQMHELPDILPSGGLLVVNDSRVRKARVYGHTDSGREREFLLVRKAEDRDPGDGTETWLAMTRRAARLATGTVVAFPGDRHAVVCGHDAEFILLRFDSPLGEAYFQEHGHVPLPPYIRRDDGLVDEDRYQTVYAARPGSVAAPTAGLHLTAEMMARISARGIDIVHVTLHVGPGTFLPVRSETVEEHVMHREEYEIPHPAATALNTALRESRPIVAVGTTSVRTLESGFSAEEGGIHAGRGSTRLFIRPGYEFQVISGMVTNFHTPESTLLMLVCAFAGRDRVLSAYRQAIAAGYRFFSYGDGMVIQ